MKTNKTFDASVLALVEQYPDFRLFQVNDENTVAVLVIRENDRIVDTYTAEKNKLVKNFGLFMCMFNRDYHDFSDDGKFDNCKWLYEPERKSEEKPKKATPRKPRTRKPTPAKGDPKAIDFNAFKGTKSEKNRALHAELVSRGMKDSRSDEYQAIWTARPWAKA